MFCLVLLPYKITLLSNHENGIPYELAVLLPYKITLLSNGMVSSAEKLYVLLPYKITLLSNRLKLPFPVCIRFTTL